MNQQTGLRLPSFFITEPAPCPYIKGQMERKLFTHLAGSDADAEQYADPCRFPAQPVDCLSSGLRFVFGLPVRAYRFEAF